MPKITKSKTTKAASPVKKRAAAKKKSLYKMPEHIEEGTFVTDLRKNNWRVGLPIGKGGFGVIYSAAHMNAKTYNRVIKLEPADNGPLFVEMHFYIRNLQLENIESFKQKHNLKSLGVPYLLGTGSVDINCIRHRFIVIPRYGSDLCKYLDLNNSQLPEGTVCRIAIQMLYVFEFIHSSGYVHADLKAGNILIGSDEEGISQAYLVDYGLAARVNTKNFKPDPKKMHNGTLLYTSRDAHNGITTVRSDLEILGYNLIEWLGGRLPWYEENLTKKETIVQNAKEQFMSDVANNLKKLYAKGVPVALKDFMVYVASLKYEDTPDYDKCRRFFNNTLISLKMKNTGDLIFKASPSPAKHLKKRDNKACEDSSSEEIVESDENDDSIISPAKMPKKVNKGRLSKNVKKSPINKLLNNVRVQLPKKTPEKINSPAKESTKKTTTTNSSPIVSPKEKTRTPIQTKANINIKPAFNIGGGSRKSPRNQTPSRPGKTIINDNMTPPVSAKGNTYEFNFELDVSMDANVIVNVNRKKRAKATNGTPKPTTTTITQSTSGVSVLEEDKSPITRAKLRKLNTNKSDIEMPVASKIIKTKRK